MTDHRSPATGRRMRRVRRGSTLVEIGLAMLLFMIVAGSVTAAATRAIGKDASSQLEQMAGDALEGLLAQVEAGGYAAALGVEHDATLPGCPTGPGVCVDVGPHRGRTVAFDVEVLRDTRLAATVTSVQVTASVAVPGGLAVTRAVRVLAPASGFAPGDRGVVRVAFDGPAPTKAYLLDSDNEAVVGSADTAGGVAVVTVPPAACTGLDPCRVALSIQAPYFDADGIGMTASGAQTLVTATNAAVTDITAATHVTGAATIALAATSPDGTASGPPTEPGSVCLWATLPAGDGAPLCNLDDPSTIDAARYPLPGREDLTVPLPAGVALTVTTDAPDGACPPTSGAVGHRSAGWEELAVCTSWTWGHPATWQAGTDTPVAFDAAALALAPSGGPAEYTATWSGADAQPAAGLGAGPVWAKPREAPGCASDGTCVPLAVGAAPEAAECPGQHCFSVASLPPRLTAPRQGAYGVATAALDATATRTPVTLTFSDADNDTVAVTLVEAPTGGTLVSDGGAGVPLALGDTVTTFTGNGTVELAFDEPAPGDQLHRFTLALDDGRTVVTQPVGLYRGSYTWTVDTDVDAVTFAQGSSGNTVKFVSVGTGGERLPNAPVDVTIVDAADATLQATSVITDVDGNGAVTIDLTGNPAAGSYEIRFTATDSAISGIGSPATVVGLTVSAVAGQLTVNAADVAQGGTATVTATSTDLAGDPMADVVVRLALPDAPGGVTLDSYRCVTTTTGTCTVNLLTDTATPSGTYTAEASSGAFSASDTYTVAPVVSALRSDGAEVDQGGTGTLAVTVLDQASQPAPGASVTATSPTPDVTVTSTATAGSDGAASFAVTVAAGAEARDVTVTVTSGGVTAKATVTIVGVPATVSAAPTSLTLGRATAGTVTVTVADAAGRPLPGVRVTSAVTGVAVAVDAAVTTGADGSATFTVESRGRTGSGSVTFTAGAATATVDVTLTGAS